MTTPLPSSQEPDHSATDADAASPATEESATPEPPATDTAPLAVEDAVGPSPEALSDEARPAASDMRKAKKKRRKETFADYLAKRLIADKGMARLELPEAANLEEACDILLGRVNEGLLLMAIVDRERHPDRVFSMPESELLEIGKACLPRAGQLSVGGKAPVGIQIIEVSSSPAGGDDEARLKRYQRIPGLKKVGVSAYHMDTGKGHVWTSAILAGRLAWGGYFEKLLRGPRMSEKEMAAIGAADTALGKKVRPIASIAMVAVLVLMYIGQHLFAAIPAKNLFTNELQTLVALGAANRSLILSSGEWHRLLSSALLHNDGLHLLLNCVALIMAGATLEWVLGRAWLLGLFLLGVLGGSLAGLLVNPPDIVSIGASGGIMGLFAAALSVSFRLPESQQRTQIQLSLFRVLIPSLIPLATTHTGEKIDYAAHIGGALAGAALGVFLVKSWPRSQAEPPFRGAAKGLAIAACALFALSLVLVKVHYPEYSRGLEGVTGEWLIPDSALPKEDSDVASRAPDLFARYPHDPRAKMFMAIKLDDEGKSAEAEAVLREALDETMRLKWNFPERRLESGIRAVLAQVLLQQGRRDEAVTIVQPVCAAGPDGTVPEMVQPLGLCAR